jgi:phosphoglycerate-specific signal transduction histidine kinase
MNEESREASGTTNVEIPVSKPTAGRECAGRSALGIKTKLFLAFGGMAMLTAIATTVAWYAFTDIERSVTRITAESIVGMPASLRLAEKSAEIAATAPALIGSRNDEGSDQQQERIIQKLNELSAVTEGLKAAGVTEARLANLIETERMIANELKALNGAVEQRQRLSLQRETAVADLAVQHAKFHEV